MLCGKAVMIQHKYMLCSTKQDRYNPFFAIGLKWLLAIKLKLLSITHLVDASWRVTDQVFFSPPSQAVINIEQTRAGPTQHIIRGCNKHEIYFMMTFPIVFEAFFYDVQ